MAHDDQSAEATVLRAGIREMVRFAREHGPGSIADELEDIAIRVLSRAVRRAGAEES